MTLQTPALFPPRGWQPDETPRKQNFCLSANPNLSTEILAAYLIDNYFDPSDSYEAPSWTEQLIRFEDETLFVGATLGTIAPQALPLPATRHQRKPDPHDRHREGPGRRGLKPVPPPRDPPPDC